MNLFEGDKVRLRAVEPDDLAAFLADTDTDVARAGHRVFPPRSVWATTEWLRQRTEQASDDDHFVVAMESVASGDIVGTLSTNRCDPVSGTCSYGLGIWAWAQRQGFGREAVVIVLRYLFGERRYQKCTVGVYGFNEPSLAFHAALGFQVEGRIRRAHFALGQHHDEVLLGITAEEFSDRWGWSGPVG